MCFCTARPKVCICCWLVLLRCYFVRSHTRNNLSLSVVNPAKLDRLRLPGRDVGSRNLSFDILERSIEWNGVMAIRRGPIDRSYSPLFPLHIGEAARQIPNPILFSMSPATASGSSKYL